MHPFKLAHSYLCHTRAGLKNDFIKRKYEASIQNTSRASLAERRLIGQICICGIPRSWHWLMRINWIKWDPEKCNPTKLFLFFDFVKMMNGNKVKVQPNT